MRRLVSLLLHGVAAFGADQRLPVTWDAARPYTAGRGLAASAMKWWAGLLDEVVGGTTQFGTKAHFDEEVVGDANPFNKYSRFLAEEVGSGSGPDSGSGSGSGEETSGDSIPSMPRTPPPPPPPSSPVPVSPPFAPGVVTVVKNFTKIVFEVTVAGDVSSFDEAAYEANLRTAINCGPDASIELEVSAASVNVRATVLVAEDDSSVNAEAVVANAEALAEKTPSEISTDLGVSVEQVSPVVTTRHVETDVQVAPPPPLMPPPSMPPPLSPSAPPPTSPASDDSDGGMETWLLAVIIIGGALVLLVGVLLCYRSVTKGSTLKNTAVGNGGNFPLAVGASTTQHV